MQEKLDEPARLMRIPRQTRKIRDNEEQEGLEAGTLEQEEIKKENQKQRKNTKSPDLFGDFL